ncbi:flagellar basal body rod protein FlgC [Pleomorphomonas sp. JP5]|uniref:flagellar basal body rod protein FlgC n=1 Tax=Pleomorphomonas sp. JP5 TaxID=2942998 RepID=UPI00204463FF|nr:flagellar basal body rod C-terminal domain-containing protein [Pleomorphomonas sp. JP5]MCM5558050.1 flagellar biosynthesis protein FlgC [Pleomorphomonas sp. JP5]
MSISSISLSGMQAATTRLEASAQNIANAQSSGRLASGSTPSTAYTPVTVTQSDVKGGGVSARIVNAGDPHVPSYDPSSPDADAEGMVAAPNVDMASELVNVMTARISYEASIKTLKVGNDMLKTTLDAFS